LAARGVKAACAAVRNAEAGQRLGSRLRPNLAEDCL
jgi:hypothetical protein